MHNGNRPEFNNISFKDLDDFINQWVVSNRDLETTFINQARQVNECFALVGIHDQKCNEINRLVNLLQHFYHMIELNMSLVSENMQELQHCVFNLEKKTKDLCVYKDGTDKLRISVYPYALGIRQAINEMSDFCEELFGILCQDCITNHCDNVDNVMTKILDQHVVQLNASETKIRRIENMLQVLDNKYELMKLHGFPDFKKM